MKRARDHAELLRMIPMFLLATERIGLNGGDCSRNGSRAIVSAYAFPIVFRARDAAPAIMENHA